MKKVLKTVCGETRCPHFCEVSATHCDRYTATPDLCMSFIPEPCRNNGCENHSLDAWGHCTKAELYPIDSKNSRYNVLMDCDDYMTGHFIVVELPAKKSDAVNEPSHYMSRVPNIECIEVVQHFNFNLGNAIKYIWRAGIKDESKTIEDLKKARRYLQYEINNILGREHRDPIDDGGE